MRGDGPRVENVSFEKRSRCLYIALAVALVCCANNEIVCLKNRRDVPRVIALVCFTLNPFKPAKRDNSRFIMFIGRLNQCYLE